MILSIMALRKITLSMSVPSVITLSIKILSIVILSIMILSIMILSIMILSIMILSIVILSIMILGIMILSIMGCILKTNYTVYGERHYAEGFNESVIILSDDMLGSLCRVSLSPSEAYLFC
jgi:hypothetical protein